MNLSDIDKVQIQYFCGMDKEVVGNNSIKCSGAAVGEITLELEDIGPVSIPVCQECLEEISSNYNVSTMPH